MGGTSAVTGGWDTLAPAGWRLSAGGLRRCRVSAPGPFWDDRQDFGGPVNCETVCWRPAGSLPFPPRCRVLIAGFLLSYDPLGSARTRRPVPEETGMNTLYVLQIWPELVAALEGGFTLLLCAFRGQLPVGFEDVSKPRRGLAARTSKAPW